MSIRAVRDRIRAAELARALAGESGFSPLAALGSGLAAALVALVGELASWPAAVAVAPVALVCGAFAVPIFRSSIAGIRFSGGTLPRVLLLRDGSGLLDEWQPESTVAFVGSEPMPSDPDAFGELLDRRQVDVVLLEAMLSTLEFRLAGECARRRIQLYVLSRPSYGLVFSGGIVRLGGRVWLPLRPLPLRRHHEYMKRALDLCLLVCVLPLSIPLGLGIAAMVLARCGRPVLYHQTRVGRDGEPFTLLKFRTMRADAERESGAVIASQGDERVTPLGRRLRRYRLDELPQLWNVARGEMSLVGPRPERPEIIREQGFDRISGYDSRHLVAPGLTGIAQLVCGYGATAEEKLTCDLFYVSSRSTWLDLRLIAATARDLLRGFPYG